MKALKGLVIGMGLLIVVGLALLGYGMYRNVHHAAPAVSPEPAGAPAVPPAATVTEGRGFFATELPIPAGTRLEQVATAGNRIVLRLSGGEGDRLLLLDPYNGQISGTVTLVPEHR